MAGGIQAGSSDLGLSTGQSRRKAAKSPLEKWSASEAFKSEQRVIFSIETVQPMAAATLPMAVTNVVQRRHVVL